MKDFRWSDEKNDWLKAARNISFEEALLRIEAGEFLDVIVNGNSIRYPNQRVYIVELGGYAYRIPFVENEKEIFLKTIFPSRKDTKKYLTGG